MTRAEAEAIVDAVLDDLGERAGIGNELERIEPAVRATMREDLVGVVLGAAST